MKQLVKIALSVLILTGLGNLSVLSAELVDSEGISGDIFGKKNGIIHPFIQITEKYSDNLLNSNIDEDSDLITTVSPGIALAIPGTDNTDLRINTATAAPGGLALSRYKMATRNRYQGIAVYNPKFEMYKDHSDENFTSHNLKGAFQYNAPGGLTIDIADQYQYAQEMWGESDNPDTEAYSANLTHMIVEFAFSSKFSISTGGAYNTITYEDRSSEFRDRNDSVYSGSLNFHLSPKTRLFCEYKHINVAYDSNISAVKDSSEDAYYAGVSWEMTAKSQGTCKAGYVTKDFDEPVINDPSSWTAEIDLTHRFTDRTSITIGAARRFYETNLLSADYYTTNRFNITYSQAFTPKLYGSLLVSYQNDVYEGVETENNLYSARPGIAFSPYRWLTCELAYSHSKRDSNEDRMDYATNEYIFSIKASL